MKNVAILVGVPLGLWALLAYPGWLIWGDASFRHAAVAMALCLGPAVATFVVIHLLSASAETRLMSSLGASGIRMAVALGGGMLLTQKWPELFPGDFMVWLTIFYLLILGLEVGLLVRQPPNETTSPPVAKANEAASGPR